jgi:rubredoxin
MRKRGVRTVNFKCKHCNTVSEAEKWDEETNRYCGGILKGIEEGYNNLNYYYVCPKCGERMYKNDWKQE